MSTRCIIPRVVTALFILHFLPTAACGQATRTTATTVVRSALPGVITTNRPITKQIRKTYSFPDVGIHFNNSFDGARLNDVRQTGKTNFTVTIKPENVPVNDAAWFAFKVWSKSNQTIEVTLDYQNGRPRYVPKISFDRVTWQTLSSNRYTRSISSSTAALTLDTSSKPLFVAGQELFTPDDFKAWVNQLTQRSFVSSAIIGRSAAGRPISKFEITECKRNPEYVFLIGRQHPPEVTGTLALRAFVETLCGDSDLARSFRQRFKVIIVPLVNPDGVAEGHWRHSLHGVDLNRDWGQFNQPETRVLRDEFLRIATNAKVRFGIDFHSTRYDVFYPVGKLPPSGSTPVAGENKNSRFLRNWLDGIQARVPDYKVHIEESSSDREKTTLVSTAWMTKTFDIPAVTYEIGDETDRKLIEKVSSNAAIAMMELLSNTTENQ